ncbi:NUDIX hydrolase [[Bacillus] enclensis]|uniref:NUDIX hydrolase n=1 Tax=[Bacillus] enclensis TaxID=1402860 RepID=UPI0018DCC3CA|nr:NUDIX hydrolase [[Bacillus] enclensis]MBH9965312.1 NUDIX hydrolase [[Bacillus] enclensis]
MTEEKLAIFDEDYNRLGERTRTEVHALGYWHETFHCWMAHYNESRSRIYIYFQLRSESKKDYPGLLDITAAGHILSQESMEDGVREIHEELGVEIPYDQLIFAGIMKEELNGAGIVDRELANVYLYTKPISFDSFRLQTEELSGIFRTTLDEADQLFHHAAEEISLEGFVVDDNQGLIDKKWKATIQDFVAHPISYFQKVINRIKDELLEK